MKGLLLTASLVFATSASALVAIPQETRSDLRFSHTGELKSFSIDEVSNRASNADLAEMEREALSRGQDGTVRVAQKFQNVPVYGGEVAFQIKSGKVTSKDGRLSPVELDSVEATVTKAQAEKIAAKRLGSAGKFESKLVVYPLKQKTYLVWQVVEKDFMSKWNFFVDAKTGAIVYAFNALPMGKGRGHDGEEVEVESTLDSSKNIYVLKTTGAFARETYDAGFWSFLLGTAGLPGKLAKSNNDQWTDPSYVDAHNFAGNYLKVLKDKFKRNSFDDKGAVVMSTVHFKAKYVNAFWNDKQMVYGDGDDKTASDLSGALDVVAHEITHAITTHTANLNYVNESGALNEAFSDIMATYAEFLIQPKKFDWIIGEDVWTPAIPGDGLRYMANPTKDGRSSDHYADRYKGSQDNGGVHLNSGIANLAFYLLSEGGVHPRKAKLNVSGLGIEKAITLFYNTFTKRLTSNSTFKDARSSMLKEAVAMGPAAEKAVADAWSAVGVE